MSIKTRLLLSYIAMSIVPVVLFGLTASILASVFFGDMAAGGLDKGRHPFWNMFNERNELFAGVKFMAQHDPDRLLESGIMEDVAGRLNPLQAAVVLVKDGEVAFASPSLNERDVAQLLQGPRRVLRWTVTDAYVVEPFAFSFRDQRAGTVYFLSDPRQLLAIGRNFVLSLVLALLVITVLTNGVLTYLVSRSIIKPLQALKRVALDIKEGNLERPVRLNRQDELGELGDAFEDMRGRLQDSIRLQLQSEEQRKELIASISHDLKTPITGIQACVQVITEGIADTEPKREKYLKMIALKSAQLNRLIDELFLFSKLDEKKLPYHWEELDMTVFVNDLAEELQLDPRMEDIHIACSCPDREPLWVLADREKLGRVFMNVIGNSLKYMDKAQKRIRLELTHDREKVTVSIEDNGSGIDQESLPHIFDRFYRVDPSRNPATGGSGLGLAIVKQIVEGHGGRVTAASKPKAGTRICFTLPRQKGKGGAFSSDAF